MCGFVGMFDIEQSTEEYRQRVLMMSKKIRHRGPDWSGIYCGTTTILSHERLSIVDPLSGKQPLYSKDGRYILTANGEIYNHKELRREFDGEYDFSTESDCEVILPLYIKYGPNFLDKLNGIFAFAIYDKVEDKYLIARDHMGIIPLYQGWDTDGHYYVASELKALEGTCPSLCEFLPGQYLTSDSKEPVVWYKRDWTDYDKVTRSPEDSVKAVKDALEAAVVRQLMCDVPYGVLLSGGLDSSVITALVAKHAQKRIEANEGDQAWWPRLHSFAIGLEGSPDLKAAQIVADSLGTVHHEVHFTIQEALDSLEDVIYHLETYDITTIRAATPMYLLARVIKSMGIKMVLSGEGSDELFGGYLYFHKAPDAREFHEETVRKLEKLHLYDCLRANKALAAWGVEGRVPFLDKEFMDVAMNLKTEDKMCNDKIEKYVVRKAFEDMLPEEVVWRQKEQFSDGVGYSWIDTLKEMTEEAVTDKQFATIKNRFPINTPSTKEEAYYRTIFSRLFPSEAAANCVPHEASVACSTATALKWDASFTAQNEPSGRAIAGIHEDAYKKK
ncbi:MAG: asparagine synthase B [Sphaerochaetaceae bacterium]|nr:asparagine synthase B [Sphaerochaetaceae bacterium]